MDMSGICYLCSQPCDPSKYREHIPPKGCFPQGSQDLITVCCCQSCNNSNSRSDEVFRMFTSLSPAQSDSARAVWECVKTRTVARGRLKKEVTEMAATLKERIIDGVQFGQVQVKIRPLKLQLIRITKGFIRHFLPGC